MKRAGTPGISRSGRRGRDVPIYRHTRCISCGTDQRVAVRYRDAVLCLDCYRRAKRQDRAQRLRLAELVRRAIAADPMSVAACRLDRLCGRATVATVASG